MKPKFFLLHLSKPFIQPVEKFINIIPFNTQYKPHNTSAIHAPHAVDRSGRKRK